MILSRRKALLGLFVAPAIIRPGLLMPIKKIEPLDVSKYPMMIWMHPDKDNIEAVNWVVQTMQEEIAKMVGIPKPYLFGETIMVGDILTSNGVQYKCLQSGSSMVDT